MSMLRNISVRTVYPKHGVISVEILVTIKDNNININRIKEIVSEYDLYHLICIQKKSFLD